MKKVLIIKNDDVNETMMVNNLVNQLSKLIKTQKLDYAVELLPFSRANVRSFSDELILVEVSRKYLVKECLVQNPNLKIEVIDARGYGMLKGELILQQILEMDNPSSHCKAGKNITAAFPALNFSFWKQAVGKG